MKITGFTGSEKYIAGCGTHQQIGDTGQGGRADGGERKAVGCRGIPQAGLCERRRRARPVSARVTNSSWKM